MSKLFPPISDIKCPYFFWFDPFLETRAEILEKIYWFFGRSFDTKRTFWNYLTFTMAGNLVLEIPRLVGRLYVDSPWSVPPLPDKWGLKWVYITHIMTMIFTIFGLKMMVKSGLDKKIWNCYMWKPFCSNSYSTRIATRAFLQNYKYSNKDDLLFARRDFKKIFVGYTDMINET